MLNVGHYGLSVTFNPTDTTDYSSVTTTASIDITQAKIAIVADSPTITYGDSPTLTNTLYTDLGPDPNNSGQDDYQELDSTALASVAYTSALGSAPAATTDAILSAGDHTINPTDISTLSPTPARSEFLNNFDVVYGPGTLTVTPATLDVTADAQTKVYGAADPTLTYVATGFQFSDNEASVLTGALTRAAGEQVAGGPYAISQGTLAANSDYTISFTGNSLTITPATLDVTADAQTKVYGAADPTLTYVATGFQFSDNEASVLTGALTRAAGEQVAGGPYAISQGTLAANSDYTISFTGNSLTITPATLVSVSVSAVNISYGTALVNTQLSGSASEAGTPVTGTFAYDPSVVGTVLPANVAPQSEPVIFTPTDTTDYNIVTATASINVAKAILSIGTVSDSLTYGTTLGYATDPTTVQDAHGHAVAGTFDFVESGSADVTDSVLDVGHYGLSVTFNPTDTTDYSSVTTTASIDITQAKIAIVADSPTITYGDSPTLTNTLYTDLGPDPNNSGQDDYQELDSTALASVAYTSALGSAPAATTDAILSAGDHTINPTDISTLSPTPARSEFLNNFDVVYGPGTLTVTPATLDVTADAQTKVYGAADPTLTYVATGFQFSDNEASVLTGALTRAAGEQVAGGPYAISQGTLAANSDYTISFTGNSLTITPATLIVTANNTTMVLGGPVPTFSAYYIGLVNGDTVSSLGNLNLIFADGSTTVSGTSSITLSGNVTSTDSDYTIVYDPGTLTVNAATKPIIIGLPPSKKM